MCCSTLPGYLYFIKVLFQPKNINGQYQPYDPQNMCIIINCTDSFALVAQSAINLLPTCAKRQGRHSVTRDTWRATGTATKINGPEPQITALSRFRFSIGCHTLVRHTYARNPWCSCRLWCKYKRSVSYLCGGRN